MSLFFENFCQCDIDSSDVIFKVKEEREKFDKRATLWEESRERSDVEAHIPHQVALWVYRNSIE